MYVAFVGLQTYEINNRKGYFCTQVWSKLT